MSCFCSLFPISITLSDKHKLQRYLSVFIYTNGKLLMVQLKKTWVLFWGPTFRWLVVHLFMPYLFSKSLSLDSHTHQDYCTIAIFIFLFLQQIVIQINILLALIIHYVWLKYDSEEVVTDLLAFAWFQTSLYRVIHGSFRTGVCDGVFSSWEVFDVFLLVFR